MKKLTVHFPRKRLGAKIIACFNQKGGVAKTTTVHNLGVELAKRGLRILLVDLDPQASLTRAAGINIYMGLKKCITDLFLEHINGANIDIHDNIMHLKNGVDLIPSNTSLASIELHLTGIPYREEMLSEILKDVSEEYDIVLIDCSPSLGNLTNNALFAADSVLIPVNTTYLSVMGLLELTSTLEKVQRHRRNLPKVEGILLTMVNERTRNFRDFSAYIKSGYGANINVYDFAVPYTVKASEAPIIGQAIVEYAPNNPAALAYSALAEEIMKGTVKNHG